jgi:hypothetical protein
MSENPTSLRSEAGGSTEAQFTIRAMLIAMSILAIVAALVGPLVRRLQPDAQFRLLVAWGIWLAVCVGWNGYRAKRRWDAERLAGESLLRLTMFDDRVTNMSSSRPAKRRSNVEDSGARGTPRRCAGDSRSVDRCSSFATCWIIGV